MKKFADFVETVEEMPEEIMVNDEIPFGDFVIVEDAAEVPQQDYEKTQDLGDFMGWISNKMTSLPPHSGKTTAGCERVIAHLKILDKEISKAISRDIDCKLDDVAVEKFRKDIRKMVKKLEKRHKEINDAYDADDEKYADAKSAMEKVAEVLHCSKGCPKPFYSQDALSSHMAAEHGQASVIKPDLEKSNASAADDDENKIIEPSLASACACHIEKTAEDNCPTCKIKLWDAGDVMECIACEEVYKKNFTKQAGSPKIQLVMTPFEKAITSIIVNGVVSQGKNAEDIYAELKKQYKFSERDELAIQTLLGDFGYPVARNLIKMPHDKSIEFMTNYQA